MDYSLKVKVLPEKGETILADSFYTAPGGKGANQAVSAKRLGAQVYMIGAIGKDSNGKELTDKLKEEGVITSGIKSVDTPTGNAMITVDHDGSNTIVVYPGANGDTDENWLIKNITVIEDADFIIMQLEIPVKTVIAAVKLANRLKKKVILNPAPASILPEEIFEGIDYITPNETELAVITGTKDIKKGAEILLNKGVENVIVTLGDKGCYFKNKDNEIYMESYKVHSIDSTAAGDSFNAAVAVALCEGKTYKQALQYANVVGALTTTELGAMETLPHKDEVERIIKNKKNAATNQNS